jgi:hypothetical protein
MQQVGGALGLAALTTVAATVTRNHLEDFAAKAAAAVKASGGTPPVPQGAAAGKLPQAVLDHALTAGYTMAFTVAVVVVAVGAVIAFLAVRVKHQELNAEHHPGVVV